MAPHEGLGAVIGNGGELSSGFDEFEVPRPSSDVISSRMFGFTFPSKGKVHITFRFYFEKSVKIIPESIVLLIKNYFQ